MNADPSRQEIARDIRARLDSKDLTPPTSKLIWNAVIERLLANDGELKRIDGELVFIIDDPRIEEHLAFEADNYELRIHDGFLDQPETRASVK